MTEYYDGTYIMEDNLMCWNQGVKLTSSYSTIGKLKSHFKPLNIFIP
jgi:hypothetical protein